MSKPKPFFLWEVAVKTRWKEEMKQVGEAVRHFKGKAIKHTRKKYELLSFEMLWNEHIQSAFEVTAKGRAHKLAGCMIFQIYAAPRSL